MLLLLIVITILLNSVGLYFPILRNDDSVLYATIAKHIVLSNDWINLTFLGNDWLDKPHLPFWITAVSFKVFGINSFAYILPGFLFHIIGGYYTYRLAMYLYNNIQIGLLSALFYFSALHLLLSSIDVRAEAYLLGMIIPACYYWYVYLSRPSIYKLFLGALFTALALMTKGIFVLIPVFSGVAALYVRTFLLRYKNTKNTSELSFIRASIISLFFRMIVIAALITILIMPEIISLYLQFDVHPDKIIFSRTNVSGVGWFFWGSQFGRFFNNGPIIHQGSLGIAHYFYFLHTFLWAFLPWSVFFILSLCGIVKHYIKYKTLSSIPSIATAEYYLLWSFIPTFILFSLTSFQLDHYTNIIIPFAAILSGSWVDKRFRSTNVLIYLTIFINVVFLLAIIVQGYVYARYDVGYQMAKYLNKLPERTVLDYKVDSLTLEFYLYNAGNTNNINNANSFNRMSYKPYNHYKRLYNEQDILKTINLNANLNIEPDMKLDTKASEFYLVLPQTDVLSVTNILWQHSYDVININTISGATIDKAIPNLLMKHDPKLWLSNYTILYIKPRHS
jgi:4-amino-4-deoxy-L-arabinose transferase-like glycosyltransferase